MGVPSLPKGSVPPPKVILPPLLTRLAPNMLMPPVPVPPVSDANRMALPWVVRLALLSVAALPTTMSVAAFKVMVPEVGSVLVPPALTVALPAGPFRKRLPAPASTVILPTFGVEPAPVVAIESAVVGVRLTPPLPMAVMSMLPLVVVVPLVPIFTVPVTKRMPGPVAVPAVLPVKLMPPVEETKVSAWVLPTLEIPPKLVASDLPVSLIRPLTVLMMLVPLNNEIPVPAWFQPSNVTVPAPLVIIVSVLPELFPSCTPP